MESTECVVVLVTVGSHEEGERIATTVVTEQLAACVNIVGPISSIYRWDHQVQRDEEWLLVMKSRAALFDDLAARVKALHSYQTPEVIAVPIASGSQTYLEWLLGATRTPPQ
jgi:periplasmic divalent cation tolerance protein